MTVIQRILLAIFIVSLSAQFSYELNVGHEVVPITLQSLSILAVAAFLSPIESVTAMLLYVFLGGIGIPIFADGTAGVARLVGPTGGYFVGFVLAAGVVSYLTYQKSKSFIQLLGIILAGTVIILIPGFIYLSYLKGVDIAWQYGFMNLYKGAMIKILLGAIIVYAGKRFKKTSS